MKCFIKSAQKTLSSVFVDALLFTVLFYYCGGVVQVFVFKVCLLFILHVKNAGIFNSTKHY